MSGDVQTRQRRKEKKKQKRDEAPLPGIDTSKFNETEKKSVQMHINESDHHGAAGICAKVIFFTLMAILLGLVTLIVLENRGGSDVDTPLSESRFSEYLQGWVDENRQDDHHEEPHFSAPDEDHDDNDHATEESHHDGEQTEINDNDPYPEEKDVSNNENDDEENSQELNAEINNNDNESQEDNDNASQENDDDNNDQNENEPEETDENDGLEDNNEPEVPNLFEDSAPFDEEGDDDDEGIADSKDIFENVVDNDAGEEILLQKLAEESEQEQNQQQDQDENEEEGSSSLMVKLGVGVLLAIVAHQIIIKKISATNSSDTDTVDAELIAKENENALSKRRFTMLSNSEEQLVGDDIDNEEIIEVMMISTPNFVQNDDEEQFTESDIDEDELGETEEYSEEIIDEFEADIKSRVPQTFEEFQNMYKPQSEYMDESNRKVTFDEPKDVEKEVENEIEERILAMPETSNVQATPKSEIIVQTEEIKTAEDYEPDIDIEDDEMGEEEEEEEEMSGDELMDEDDLDYEQSDEDLSDIDDSDLLNRLEAKYGKISNSDKSNEEENDDGSWTKIPEGGGAQSSYMEELLRQQALEENY